MTSIEAYKSFETKLNNLDNASNIDISIGEFVLLFNEYQNKWYIEKFSGRSTRGSIDDVQSLSDVDKPLVLVRHIDNYSEFEIPSNYMDYISSYALANKGSCKHRRLFTHEEKLYNKDLSLQDEYNTPSFEFNETLVTIAEDKIQVYKTDFNIESVFLTYYRYPKAIDIAGYKKIDGSTSITINPELSEIYVIEIIDMCVVEVQRSSENTTGFQLSTDRVNKNK